MSAVFKTTVAEARGGGQRSTGDRDGGKIAEMKCDPVVAGVILFVALHVGDFGNLVEPNGRFAVTRRPIIAARG